MNDEKLSNFYDDRSKNYHSRTDILKFLLMPFAFIVILGLPGKYGSYVSTYSNFVAQAFFILFGFFTLVPDKDRRGERIKKSLKRAFNLFAIMFLSYIVLNIFYLAYFNSLQSLLSEAFLRKRTLFNFLVLNVWPLPIGNSIWFIQSLTFAYLFFLISEKINLDKFYIPILIVLVIFMLATGEFAAFCGFPHFGYSYIPAGTVTRAIPYMLIGMVLRKNVDKLTKIPKFVHLLLFVIGLLAAIGEIKFLSHIGKLVYVGHTLGFGLMALSLCCFALAKPEVKTNFLTKHGMSHCRRMYALCQPVSFAVWIFTSLINPAFVETVRKFDSIISFIICLSIAFIVGLVKYVIMKEKQKKAESAPKNIDEPTSL